MEWALFSWNEGSWKNVIPVFLYRVESQGNRLIDHLRDLELGFSLPSTLSGFEGIDLVEEGVERAKAESLVQCLEGGEAVVVSIPSWVEALS